MSKWPVIIFILLVFHPILFVKAQAITVIPQPVSIHQKAGYFTVYAATTIVVVGNQPDLQRLGLLLKDILRESTGQPIRIGKHFIPGSSIVLRLTKATNEEIGAEGYILSVKSGAISLEANTAAGIFYGIQTLIQLIPVKDKSVNMVSRISCVDVIDYPRFGWRGLMLDVSRHFFSKEVVKRFIDQMAAYKFNVFHWHLSDDEGWRLEIKGLPQLTDIGAWRVNRTGPFGMQPFQEEQPGEKASYGGYYTQPEVLEIIAYAQERFINIIPEIDVPGHCLAMIASFHNLSCNKYPYAVGNGNNAYRKKDNVLCVATDSVYILLDTIISQIARLFPSPYIHIGGDEVYTGYWDSCVHCKKLMADHEMKHPEELQSYFLKRVEKMVYAHGKKLIGWDEIGAAGLTPGVTVMSWRGMKGGTEAALAKHPVVMTPVDHCYLDLAQGDSSLEPYSYGKRLIGDMYQFEPVPADVDARYILGGQGNVWTAYIPDERNLQYMTWPRAFALAEVLWSPKDKRDSVEFMSRVEIQFARLRAAHINYAVSMYDPVVTVIRNNTGKAQQIKLRSQMGLKLQLYYTFDTTNPDDRASLYTGDPVFIPNGAAILKVISYRNNQPLGRQLNVKLADYTK